MDLNETQTVKFEPIEYGMNNQRHYLDLSVKNDGQTKTICLFADDDDQDEEHKGSHDNFGSGFDHELIQKQEDEAERKKLKKQEPNQVIDVTLSDLSVSFVAKVQSVRREEVLIDERRELALFTLKDIKFESDYKAKEKRRKVNFKVGHFQIDN